jgi:cell division protein FtsB
MAQRRMPTGQGPSGRGRPSGATGPRPAGQRGSARRVPRLDPPARQVALSPKASKDRGLRRGVGPARRTKAPRRPRKLSGRAAALGLLLIALALAYAYPVREYLAQEAEISAMESAQAEQRDRIRDLTERVAKWDDDNYVIAQARSRLQLVRRGEVLFVVGAEPPAVPPGEPAQDEPWISQLWSNLQAADNPGEREE